MNLQALAKELTSAIGKNDDEPEITGYLNSGHAPLNKIISGDYAKGWPYGRIAEVYGPSASGKTLIATNAMIEAQRAGGVAIFIDWERTFNGEFAARFGLDTTFPKLIYKRSETWEDGNTVAMKTAEAIRNSGHIDKNAPIVAVLDSVAAAVPKSMLFDSKGNKRGIDEYTMNDTTALARVSSTTLKAINQFVSEFNMVIIYLNQIRTKPGVVYGDPTTTPGGGAMEFYATTRLATSASRIMDKVDGAKEFTGRDVGIVNKKSKITMPFQKTAIDLIYENGIARFDYTGSLIDELVSIGKLEKEGNSIIWEGKKYSRKLLSQGFHQAGEEGMKKLNDMLLAP